MVWTGRQREKTGLGFGEYWVLCRRYIGVKEGISRDSGKENGSYYLGFKG